ncbi:MAG: metalloregulator ArsR/SmtB family transcription factor [Gemmatimonadota bacterium]|nr:metalloregulator ArsR/SmtB family transcription factor [Gemmatimonadota bacterium]
MVPPAIDRTPTRREAAKAAARATAIFHALSDETRVAALQMLRGGERCVCELQDELGAAQSRLSFHLRVLKDAGLVTDRREGRWAYYSIVPDALQEAHDIVRELASAPSRRGLRVLGSCCG